MDSSTKDQWKQIIKSGLLKEIIEESISDVEGRFHAGSAPSSDPHIQSENNGGFRCLMQFSNAMLSMPFREIEPESTEEKSQYIL